MTGSSFPPWGRIGRATDHWVHLALAPLGMLHFACFVVSTDTMAHPNTSFQAPEATLLRRVSSRICSVP